ncbi:Ger(x)C family spore germination protein [Lentibacillus lipolyticus]|nr:Ger(x)C family spore germination protein [Lentibacillus lipolyticus]
MGRNYVIFILLVVISMAVNYGMPKKVIDQVQIVTVAGHDLAENDKVKTTVVAPFFAKEGELMDLLYTSTASSIYKNKIKLNAQSSEQLLIAKEEVILYNQDLASKGLEDYVSYLFRDPSMGADLLLAVVEDSTEEVLSSVDSSKGTGIYIQELLEHNTRHGHLPSADLKVFGAALKSKRRDPFLPLLALKEGKPHLKGLAFFDDDKLVDTIPITKAGVFRLLYERVDDGQYNMTTSDYKISVQNIESSRNIDAVKKGGQPEVTISVRFKGVVREFSEANATKKLPEIEKAVEKDFRKKAKKMVKRFQELNIDPLHIEGYVKGQVRKYNKKQFKQAYPEIPINIQADVSITESGARN